MQAIHSKKTFLIILLCACLNGFSISTMASSSDNSLPMATLPSGEEFMPNIRTALYQIDQTHKLLMIGIDQQASPYPGIDLRQFSNSTIGFSSADGRDISNVAPMFLIALSTEKGITKIYDFSADTIIGNTITNPGLPPKLMNVQAPYLSLLGHGVLGVLNDAIYFTPFAYIAGLTDKARSAIEQRPIFRASWLSRILAQAKLDQKSSDQPIFGSLTIAEVDLILASLHLRYNEEHPYAGILVSKKNRVDYYNKYFALKSGRVSANRGELIKHCNELGLVLVPISEDYSMIFADTNSSDQVSRLQSHLIGLDEKKYHDYCDKFIRGNGLCPIGLFSMNGPYGPQESLTSDDLKDNTLPKEIKEFYLFANKIGLTFASNIFLEMGIVGGEKVLRFMHRKLGHTLTDTAVTSYSEFKAIMDSGMLQISPLANIVSVELVQQALKDLTGTKEYSKSPKLKQMVVDYSQEIAIPNISSARLSSIWSEALTHLIVDEQRKAAIFFSRKTTDDIANIHYKNWTRLGLALSDPKWIEKIRNNIDNHSLATFFMGL